MDDADYSEEDIKQQLAALGFRHISEQRLREFKRDFDELVRHEKSKSRASSDWSSAASHSSSSPPPQVKEKVQLNVAPNRNYVPFKSTSGGQQSNIFSSTFHEDDHRKSDTNHLYDTYSCHVVAQKPHRPLAAHNRLEIEEGPLILNSAADDNESTSSGRENLVPFGRCMKRNVLRKRQGQSYVCDESIHSEVSDEESEVEDRESVKGRKRDDKETFKKGHGNKEPKKVLQRSLLKKAENTSEEMEENEVEMKRKNDSIFDRNIEGKVSEETKETEAEGSEVLEEDENDEEEEEEIQSYIGEQGKTDKKISDEEDEGESEKDGDDETDGVELDNEEEVSEVVENETQSEEEDEEESEVDEEQDEDGEQKDKQSDEEDKEDDESEQGNQSEEEEESEVEQNVKQNEQDDFKEVSEADNTGKQCKEEEEQQNVNKEDDKNEVDKTGNQNSEEEESEVEEKQNEEEENDVEEKLNEAGEEEDESEMEEEEVSEVEEKQSEAEDDEEEKELEVEEKQNEEDEVSEVDGKHNEKDDDDEDEGLEVDGKQSEEEDYEEEEECVVKEKPNEEQEVNELDGKQSEEEEEDEEEDCEVWEKQSEEEECEVEGKQNEENEEEESEFEKLSVEDDEEEESEVKQSKDEIENESEGEGKGEVEKSENQIGSPSFKSEEENGNDFEIEDKEDTEENKSENVSEEEENPSEHQNETANGHVMNRNEGERRNEEVRGYFEVEKDWLSEDSQDEHEKRLAEENEDSADESAAHSKEKPEEEECKENKEEEQVSVSECNTDEQKGKISFIQEESSGHSERSDSTKMKSISEEERKDKMDESLCFVDDTASEEEEEKCFKSDSDKRIKTVSNPEKVKEDDTQEYLDLMWFESEDKPQSETEEEKHSFLAKDSQWHQISAPDIESSNQRQEEEQADGSLNKMVSSSIISETELCHQDRTSQACNEGCVKVSIRDPSQEDDCTPVPSWEQLGEERQKNGCGGLDVEKVTSEDLHESLGSPAASILTSGYGTYRPDSSKGDPEESDYRDDCTLEGLEEETEYNLDLRDYDNHTSPLWFMGQASQESLDRNAPGQRIDGKRGHGQCGREDDDHQSFEKHKNNEQVCTAVAKSCSEAGDYQAPQNHWDSVSLRDHLDHPFNLRHTKGRLEHILEEKQIQEKKPQKGKRAKALSSSPAVGELEEHLDHMRIGTSRSYCDTECEDTGSSDDRSCSDKDDSLSAMEDYSKCRRRANSEAEIQTRPKSFIRPVFDHPNTRNWKKSDPVARYFQYKQEWETFKPPGEKSRKELRWAIREQLVRQLPPQKSQKTYTANNYVPPNEKKRSALRWDIRHDLTHGLN